MEGAGSCAEVNLMTHDIVNFKMAEHCDAPVVLGGNIGTPLIERLPQLSSAHRVVLELSELQLPTLSRGTDIAVYTHVTSDHLDRHGTLEAYRAAKRSLFERLAVSADNPEKGCGKHAVVNADDPQGEVVAAAARQAGARVWRYGLAGDLGAARDRFLAAASTAPRAARPQLLAAACQLRGGDAEGSLRSLLSRPMGRKSSPRWWCGANSRRSRFRS